MKRRLFLCFFCLSVSDKRKGERRGRGEKGKAILNGIDNNE